MKFLVAYNGSRLSEKALEYAEHFSRKDDEVIALTVIPRHPSDADEMLEFHARDYDEVEEEARERIREKVPGASFVAVDIGRPASAARIGHMVRDVAHDEGADVVLVGSMKAGRIVSNISSPATQIVTDLDYDVVVVRSDEE